MCCSEVKLTSHQPFLKTSRRYLTSLHSVLRANGYGSIGTSYLETNEGPLAVVFVKHFAF
jgi:hypothetical protein